MSYNSENVSTLKQRLDKLEADVRAELKRQGFEGSRVQIERMLNMRFDGTDTALMVLPDGKEADEEDFLESFRRSYKEEFGFLLDTKTVIVDDIKVILSLLFHPIFLILMFLLFSHVGTGYRENLRFTWTFCIQ